MFPKQSVNTPTNIVTTGSNILMGNGSGGVGNVTIGANLTFTGGTLTATGGGSTGTMPPGWVNVMDYGAVGNAYAATPHDDTAAFQAALATGNNVWFPIVAANGTFLNYLISGTLTPGVGQGIMGSGHPQFDAVVYPRLPAIMKGNFIFTGTNIPCINLVNYGAWCENISVMQQYQNLAVAGNAHFAIGATSGSVIPSLFVKRCNSTGAWAGFLLHGQTSNTVVEYCTSCRANYAGFWITMQPPFGSYYVNNCFDQASPQNNGASPFFHPYSGWSLLVDGTDTAVINNFYGMAVNIGGNTPAGGVVNQLHINMLNIESFQNCPLPNLVIGGTNPYGGLVEDLIINNLEIDQLQAAGATNGTPPTFPLYVGPTVIASTISNGAIKFLNLEDHGSGNTFSNIKFDNRGAYLQPYGAKLYGIGTQFINNDFWNFQTYITISSAQNSKPGTLVQGCSDQSFNTGNVGIDASAMLSGRLIGNDFSSCTTPVVRPQALFATRGVANIGATDW